MIVWSTNQLVESDDCTSPNTAAYPQKQLRLFSIRMRTTRAISVDEMVKANDILPPICATRSSLPC